jgi:hypothetical protein
MIPAQHQVDRALDAALANGFDDVRTDDPSDVAWDLQRYDSDLESCEVNDLVPLVESWQARKRGME